MIISQYGIIAEEPKKKFVGQGTLVTEVGMYFHSYVPFKQNVTFKAKVSFWGKDAEFVLEQAEKHTKKDGTHTNGKGMRVFVIGHLFTEEFKGTEGNTVRLNKISSIKVSFSEVPVISTTGFIGTEVEKKSVELKDKSTRSVVNVPVFFNSFIPGVDDATLETFVTFWGREAEWLSTQANKHVKKDTQEATNGKGMAIQVIGIPYTESYEKDGVTKKVTKIQALHVSFPNNGFAPRSNDTTTNTQSKDQNTNDKTTSNAAPPQAENQPENKPSAYNEAADDGDIAQKFSAFFNEEL